MGEYGKQMQESERRRTQDPDFARDSGGGGMGTGKATEVTSKVLAMFLKVDRIYAEVHFIVLPVFNGHLCYIEYLLSKQ